MLAQEEEVRPLGQAISDGDWEEDLPVAITVPDVSIDRLKTNGAVRDLRERGLLARTPRGYRATTAGLALLQASHSEPIRKDQ